MTSYHDSENRAAQHIQQLVGFHKDEIIAELKRDKNNEFKLVNNLAGEMRTGIFIECAEGIIGRIIGMKTYEMFPNANHGGGLNQLGLKMTLGGEEYKYGYVLPLKRINLDKISTFTIMRMIEEIREFKPTDRNGRWYITTKRNRVKVELLTQLINSAGAISISDLNDFGVSNRTIAIALEQDTGWWA